MPANLEIKVAYPGLKRIFPRLKKLGAVKTAVLMQKDTYFKSKNGLLKLRKDSTKQEFIFYNRPEKAAARWSEYHLLPMPDKGSESFFIKALETEAVVEKKRILYIYGNTRIHLDTVKNLGTFIELESVVVKSRGAAEKEFAFVKNALLLSEEKELRTSYRNLIISANKKNKT